MCFEKKNSMIHCIGKQTSGLCPHEVSEIERHLIRGTYTSPVICYKSYFPRINFIYTVEGETKRSWNVSFQRAFNDWELDSSFFWIS